MKKIISLVLLLGFFLIGGSTDSVSSPLAQSNDIVQVGDQLNVIANNEAFMINNVIHIEAIVSTRLIHSQSYIALQGIPTFHEAVRNKGNPEALLHDDYTEFKSYQITTKDRHYWQIFVTKGEKLELSRRPVLVSDTFIELRLLNV